MKRMNVAVLGATGVVGQQFVRMLVDHPYFRLAALAASERSAGKKYGERVKWVVSSDIPEDVKEEEIMDIDARLFRKNDVSVVFSALPADIALKVEGKLASAGIAVFSNASAFRMEKEVPILTPEVNPEHIALAEKQKERMGGFIITNSNCTASGLVVALKPLTRFGIRHVTLASYQALSGAGLPGVPSLEALGNVIPFIKDEEGKVEEETRKILGNLSSEGVRDAPFDVDASCARVPVHDGHLECVVVEMGEEADTGEIKKAFSNFSGLPQKLKLPTAPKRPIVVREEEDRPQPALDLHAGEPLRARGMAISVGRIKRKGYRMRFFLLVHNTVRGAAGASILNAEFALSQKHLG